VKIAAKVDKVDEDYFRNDILPLIDGLGVEFVGEINEREKTKFLGEAAALLFPVDWPEPFGLVMIEAMACGTPVLAFRCGSIRQSGQQRARSHSGAAGNPLLRPPRGAPTV
jgi:glycosyltransferase involved in cell wall biosynthesis